MTDPTPILAANLVEAFKQVNQFVALGLVASVSSFALLYRSGPDEQVAVAGGFVPMPRDAAQLLLLAVCFVSVLMGSYSLQSASYIIGKLGASTPLVEAACTYSSVATGPVVIRVAGAAVPAVFVSVVIGRQWWTQRNPMLFWILAIFIGSYAILGAGMVRLPCTPH
jgi:hypothetical protein